MYRCVVAIEAWPKNSWTTRMSTPLRSRRVATVCRKSSRFWSVIGLVSLRLVFLGLCTWYFVLGTLYFVLRLKTVGLVLQHAKIVQSTKHKVQSTKHQAPSTKPKVQSPKYKAQNRPSDNKRSESFDSDLKITALKSYLERVPQSELHYSSSLSFI